MAQSINRRNILKQGTASLIAARFSSSIVSLARPAAKGASREWQCYGNDPGASRYSPLKQINRSNVSKLKVAWVHRTGDASQRPATTIECTPIMADGVVYLSTCQLQVHALDAATGKLLWSFDPTTVRRRRGAAGVNRAVCYWRQGNERRIFMPVKDMMFCLDATTGKLALGFGDGGVLDLKENFDCDMTGLSFNLTSPPVAYKDMILVGGGGGEGPEPAAPGHIRAFDARTGKRRWIFHTIPHPGEFGSDTWEGDSWKHAGGTNNWAGMSLDAEKGWLFASTGSPSFDFYGGNRKGANLFGNSVIALNADTGERLWHFQTTHHDVLDYDLPAQPALVKARHNGRQIDAVAQVTKTGLLFLFDRKTGKPLFPVEERPIPQSQVPGETTSPTQPFPVKPPPFSRHGFTEDEITNISPEAHAYVKKIFDQSKTGMIYMPPSTEGTFLLPGLLGGAIWGGCSFEPNANYLFVSSNDVPYIITLIDPPAGKAYRYAHKGNIPLVDADGFPACKPPWSHLTAIDLNKGEFAWRVVLGEHPALKARGIAKSGSVHVGGSIATGGGLVFIAATMDEKMRAFDSATGETLWEHQLEAGGYATPCTYEVDGRQYMVIAAGGGGLPRTKSSDAIVAFALP